MYDENLGEKSGPAKDVIEVSWNQAERQLSTLQARWCLRALRIYSHVPLHQATLGKSLATHPMLTTSSRQNKLPKGHESRYVYSRQKYQGLVWTAVVHIQLGFSLWEQTYTAISTDCTYVHMYIPSRSLVELLSVISIALDWVPYGHLVKNELTFSEVLCTEQLPACSVQEYTSSCQRK